MNNPAPDNSPSFAPWLPQNFFSGGGGSGGGGGDFGAPTVYSIIAGYTHTVWTDQYGNQKHQVADANNNVVQQAAAAVVFNGSVATLKWQGNGLLSTAQSFSLDGAQAPPNGPWKIPVGASAQLVAHQNNVVNGSGADPKGNAWTSTYAYVGGNNIAATVVLGNGENGSWTIPLQGTALNILDIWALIALFEAILALVLGLIEAPLWLVILVLLLVIAGAWWVFSHWDF